MDLGNGIALAGLFLGSAGVGIKALSVKSKNTNCNNMVTEKLCVSRQQTVVEKIEGLEEKIDLVLKKMDL